MTSYSIGELCRDFHVTPRTVRFYEARGLLSPTRRGTTRVFTERDRVRLKLTLRGRRIGLSLSEVKEIIDMYDLHEGDDTRQLLHLCEKIREHRGVLLEKLRDIEATLTAMDEVEQRCLESLGRKVHGPVAEHSEDDVNVM